MHKEEGNLGEKHLVSVLRLRCATRLAFVILVAATIPQGWSQTALVRDPTPATLDQSLAPISLDEAIKRAQQNDIVYQTAVADAGSTALDRSIARSTLLPGTVYHNQFIYTKPNRVTTTQTSPVDFISNNSEYEYVSQAVISENVGAAQIANYFRLKAIAASSKARAEVARRGLTATVVGLYYTALAAEQKLAVISRAADEARKFRDLTSSLETGGEVAHSDVVKALLQYQQRQRELADAGLVAERSKLDLGVLLFADPLTPYRLSGASGEVVALPARETFEAAAKASNPEIRAAFEAERAAQLDLSASKAAYLPSLGLAYQYGIDAPNLSVKAPDRSSNLGYAVVATFDIPVWDWFATRDRIKQSGIRRQLAHIQVTSTQRRLLATLHEFYNEAKVSLDQIQLSIDGVTNAQESLRLVGLRYQSGEATVLEVVDAQNSLVAAQSIQADSTVRYRSALANLQTLTGVLP